ncbi:hypothetical protein D3C72_727910 [compost metagenome]
MRASAFFRRFCTSTWASSGSVPGSKVTTTSAMPLELLVDSKYSRFLAPLSDSSMMLVTDSTSTLAEAPG